MPSRQRIRACSLQWPRRRAIPIAVAFVCICLLSVRSDALAAEKPTIHQVIIEGTAYQPAALTVKRGDIVEWINNDPFPHTVTAATAFDSGNIAAGKSWRYRARTVGKYSYVCSLHPNMKGVLEVR